ncbi:hypothetical protein EVAR_50281_1 [Eumeta japonica]|uniref:Uncharacterized protein n=1 Tax=Eumeta variegata TaxID=151549 RepID=A0A4C1XSF7_EUMVA|nr:hypothetical protein EVAR_50281_1 [Eumeta japonica]
MMRKQEIPRQEETSVTHENNNSTSQKSTTTKSESMSFECFDNKNEKVLSSRDTDNLCEVSIHDISLNDSMALNSNDTIDFLLKRSNFSHLPKIDKNKESLYIKFDPLYGKSDTNIQQEKVTFIHSTEFDVGYETGSTESTTDQSLNTINSSATTLNIFREKPTQIVPPVINGNTVTCTYNHTPILVRSTSAFIALREVPVANLINIERNISAQTKQSSLEYEHSDYNIYSIDVSEIKIMKNILQKQECELHQLRKENQYLKNILQSLEKRKKMMYEELASNLKVVSDENKKLIERQNKLLQRVKEKTYDNEQLCLLVQEPARYINHGYRYKEGAMDHAQVLQCPAPSERNGFGNVAKLLPPTSRVPLPLEYLYLITYGRNE